jgi:hypothetical protein
MLSATNLSLDLVCLVPLLEPTQSVPPQGELPVCLYCRCIQVRLALHVSASVRSFRKPTIECFDRLQLRLALVGQKDAILFFVTFLMPTYIMIGLGTMELIPDCTTIRRSRMYKLHITPHIVTWCQCTALESTGSVTSYTGTAPDVAEDKASKGAGEGWTLP